MHPPALAPSTVRGHVEQVMPRHSWPRHPLASEESLRHPGQVPALLRVHQWVKPVLRAQTTTQRALLDFPLHQSLEDLLLSVLVWKLSVMSGRV